MEKDRDKKELEEFNKIQGANLRRLRVKMGWSQKVLAEKAGIEQGKISAYENGLGFDKRTLIHFCKIFDVRPWEFNWEESTPVIKDDREQQDLFMRREEERLGIAERVRQSEMIWIETEKKKEGPGGKGTSGGAPRRRQRRAG